MINSHELSDLCRKEAESPSGTPCILVHKSRGTVMGVYCSHPSLAGLPIVFIDHSEYEDFRAAHGGCEPVPGSLNYIRVAPGGPGTGTPYTVLVARADPAKSLVDGVCDLTRRLGGYIAAKLTRPRLNAPPEARLSEVDRRLDEASFRPDPNTDAAFAKYWVADINALKI